MDNQKDPLGTPLSQPDARRTPKASTAAAAQPTAATAQAPANTTDDTPLDTALNSGKQWIDESGLRDSVNQLPRSLKDLGTRAADRLSGLSTTQKVVGGALLAAGLGWLATRKGKSAAESSPYNYGRQRDAGFGRRNYGYQAPDASHSRTDSGSAYGNSTSRFGSSGSYNTAPAAAGNTGIEAGRGRTDSGAPYGHASARTDHGRQAPGSAE